MIGKVNTGSKSSGGLVPQIIVTAPKGSTIIVDFTSYTLQGEETEHTFVVETGMHQITATLGTKSQTVMQQVDKIAQFRITISYMPTGLIAEYLFNGNLLDTSGNGYDLSGGSGITFPESGLGGFDKCANFGGSVYARRSADFIPKGTPFSINIWVKLASLSATAYFLDARVSEGATGGVAMGVRSNGKAFMFIRVGSTNVDTSAVTAITVNNWAMITYTFDNSTCKCYVNGNYESSNTSAPMTNRANDIIIGRAQLDISGNYYFKGLMTGLRFYNKALSAEDISTLYNGGIGL